MSFLHPLECPLGMLGDFPEVKGERKILVNILLIGGWRCRTRSSYKVEEELSWYMGLKMSCTCPKARCDLELGWASLLCLQTWPGPSLQISWVLSQ